MKVSKILNILLVVVSILMVFIGFRLVTQAGQPMNHIQNDGYAGSGGILILAGGVAIGRLMDEIYGKKPKK